MNRRTKVMLKRFAVSITAVILAGIIYEQLGEWQDRNRFPQIGRSVDIGGRALNIFCSGEGSPAVILENGLNAPGVSWMVVQQGTGKFTRACWYDRAGQAWSDAGPFPRTSATIANDLHELLRRAAVPPPYVLVGHSFGGFNVRVFTAKYPAEVAGMVLVDPAYENDNGTGGVNRSRGPIRTLFLVLAPTLSRIGLFRAISHFVPLIYVPPLVPAEQRALLQALILQSKPIAEAASEEENLNESAAEVRSASNLGDRPLILLTAGKQYLPRDPAAAREAAAWYELRSRELDPQLTRLSSRSRHTVVEGSGHMIPQEAPDAVVKAIREVVEEVRAEQPK
jgi:pimeloyl-ACP methyl ester carboxylesterase